jgi:hypothetical protein
MTQLRMDGRPVARRPRSAWSKSRILALLVIVLSIIVCVRWLTLWSPDPWLPDPMFVPLLGP